MWSSRLWKRRMPRKRRSLAKSWGRRFSASKNTEGVAEQLFPVVVALVLENLGFHTVHADVCTLLHPVRLFAHPQGPVIAICSEGTIRQALKLSDFCHLAFGAGKAPGVCFRLDEPLGSPATNAGSDVSCEQVHSESGNLQNLTMDASETFGTPAFNVLNPFEEAFANTRQQRALGRPVALVA